MTAIIIIFTIIIVAALIWRIIILEADIDTYKYQMRFQDQRIRNLYRLLLPSEKNPLEHSDKIRQNPIRQKEPIGAKLEQDGTM